MAEPPIETKIVEHGEASRLPETSWLYRRWLVFLVALACLWFTWSIIDRVHDVPTLKMIASYSLFIVAFCLFLYVGGAGAEDVVRLLTAARTTRKETIMSAPPPATATPSSVSSDPDEALFKP